MTRPYENRRVIFADGEGIVEADMDAIGTLSLQQMGDYVYAKYWRSLYAGSDMMNIAMQQDWETTPATRSITLFPSIWAQFWSVAKGASPGNDEPQIVIARAATFTATLDAASGANFRRDIVEARMVIADGATASRDFEDATTRAKTTQGSQVTRSIATIQMQVIKGVENATEGGAAEPATTSGWTKIASFLVDDSDECYRGKMVRYHKSFDSLQWRNRAIRIGSEHIHPNDLAGAGNEYLVGTGGEWQSVNTLGSLVIQLPTCPGDRVYKIALLWKAETSNVTLNIVAMKVSDGTKVTQAISPVVAAAGWQLFEIFEDEFPAGLPYPREIYDDGDIRYTIHASIANDDTYQLLGGWAFVIGHEALLIQEVEGA